jgi:hypothetical protein
MSPPEVGTAIAGFIRSKSEAYEAGAYGHAPVDRAAPDHQSRIIIVSDTCLYREGLALSLEREEIARQLRISLPTVKNHLHTYLRSCS